MLAEIREYWEALLIMVGGEDYTQREALLRIDAIDFFTALKVHERNQVEKIKRMNKYKNKYK